MDSGAEIVLDFSPYFRAYKDGHVEKFFGRDVVPPGTDRVTGVSSKDVQIFPETGVSARVFVPTTISPGEKLPLLVYFHGGGFVVGSPFCSVYHNFVTSLVKEAEVVVVSVDYRLAPEYPVPIAYEDSWAASHASGSGPEPILNEHADLSRVFLSGDSAGGNIVHNMVAQAGEESLGEKVTLLGSCLIHPHFIKREGDDSEKIWRLACPTTSGSGDPRMNPISDARLARIGCGRVLICLAEIDWLRDEGLFYYETLVKSGWGWRGGDF
ncbi:putative carboxylesterase 2 [Morus notabilis]|uniref:Putative carboxylesterase 2 n=1 Tax=Morus notabilis TaxID=981085 RepID=W9S6B1_9ROSA|nr:putative carboxylesterase 2 [Morus notabilis]